MTGLLIRDFSKQYRELRYSDSGSIGISEVEHNAYRLSLTLEVTHLDGVRYSNLKTLPENTHYGYCTLFRGSTVTENIPVKFPKFRIFDIVNQGIWNYHQATENVQVIDSLMGSYGLYYHSAHLALAESESPVGNLVRGVGKLAIPDGQGDGERLYWESQVEELTEDFDGDDGYRAYPVATPFPDIAKFKGDLKCSFLWRLEAWYLVNPLVYVLDNPTDTGDETEDEDEYPQPNEGDGDGDGDEFPSSSNPWGGSDPRDFGEQDFPGQFDPQKQARITVAVTANDGSCVAVSFQHTQVLGMLPSPPASVARGADQTPQPCGNFSVGLGFTVTLANGQQLGPFITQAGVISVSIVSVIYV